MTTLTVKAVLDFLPVHHVPPGRQIVGTAVLILQIVGVLPYVAAEHDVLAFHDGAVLVRRGSNLHARRRLQQPGPAGAEPAHAGRVELFLKRVEAAEGPDDGLRHGTRSEEHTPELQSPM